MSKYIPKTVVCEGCKKIVNPANWKKRYKEGDSQYCSKECYEKYKGGL